MFIDRLRGAIRGRVGRLRSGFNAFGLQLNSLGLSSTEKALNWIRWHEMPSGGIRVHSRHQAAYPEVTGYIIPTLLDHGARDLARRLAQWLVSVQRPEGAFTDPDFGKPNVFDTGQALRGLLAILKLEPYFLQAVRRAAGYLCAQMIDRGTGGFGTRYDGVISEGIHLYALPPLIEAAEALQQPGYRMAAEQCADFYFKQGCAFQLSTLTHFLAYELEAAIDLGHPERAKPALDALRASQRSDGSVPGVPDASWVCTPGLAQLAICWYKLGESAPADRAMRYLDAHQKRDGGFLGSYGKGGAYFPDVELAWAAKFYLDACRFRKNG